MAELTALQKLKRGIILLQKEQPFFAHLLLSMNFKPMPKNYPMQTMGVNAKGTCFYNDEFVNKLTTADVGVQGQIRQFGELEGVQCHEVLHVAFGHFFRLGGREPMLANIAQDVVVNYYVQSSGFRLPKDAIQVDIRSDTAVIEMQGSNKAGKVTIRNVSKKPWEEVYEEILRQLKSQGVKPVPTVQVGFDHHDRDGVGESVSEAEAKAARGQWEQKLCEAAAYAKQQGKLPGGMDRLIDDLVKPKVRWQDQLLKKAKQSINPVDWSWHKPHRKAQVVGVYMPSILKETQEVEVIVDTSGSIGGEELKEFLSEIVGMQMQIPYLRIAVTFVDAEVQKRYELETADVDEVLRMEPKGGGGTDMEEGLRWLSKNRSETQLVVVLTDGYTGFRHKTGDFPFDIIWCISSNGIKVEDVPYGTAIKMEG
jgi:predicted metal-dependent peptidase